MTEKRIPTPKISEYLKEDFMAPLNLSAYALAKAIHVPTSRIQEILQDKRRISIDTSIRLGKYFGLADDYFIRLQTDADIRDARNENEKQYKAIKPIEFNKLQAKVRQ